MPKILILGASSGIGKALLEHALTQGWKVVAVSRQSRPDGLACDWWQFDGSDPHATEIIKHVLAQHPDIQRVFVCFGFLQNAHMKPEKSIRQLSHTAAEHNWHVNYWLPVMHLQLLWPLLSKAPVQVLVLSAKVGSITDNQLGGWLSYRSAKAALNMAVKTAAIELKRMQPNSCLVTVHPGTTDTPLSEPFLQNLKPGQLQTPSQTAQRLWQVADQLSPEQSGALLNWDGQALPY